MILTDFLDNTALDPGLKLRVTYQDMGKWFRKADTEAKLAYQEALHGCRFFFLHGIPAFVFEDLFNKHILDLANLQHVHSI